MRSPHTVARVLLAFVWSSTVFLDRWEYSKAYQANPDSWLDVLRGTAPAPQQYRVGVERAAELLHLHGHLAMRHGFVLIDAVCAGIAVYLLLSVLERTNAYRASDHAGRWFGTAAFLFLLQYYFAWIAWYQRPETMATMLVVAATLWLLSVRLPAGSAAKVVTAVAMLALAAVQGFIRADVVFALHLGVLLVCLTRAGNGFAVPRPLQLGTSVACVAAAGGIQYYLMHVVYPNASYGDTEVIQLGMNLMEPMRWIPFVIFMLPIGWMMATLVRRRATAEAPGLALSAGAAVYFVMWCVAGKIDEVRIFLPYAVALVPLTCALAMQRFLGEGNHV